MKINVTNVGNPWRPNPEADYLYTINIEGHGEPQKTYDAKLAVLGEHEAEQFTSKTGKTYWRTPKPQKSFTPREKQFKADPESRESIEWQTSLKAAIEVVRDYYLINGSEMPAGDDGLHDYTKQVDRAAVHFKGLINRKPTTVIEDTLDDLEVELDDETTVEDLPPVELYDEQK